MSVLSSLYLELVAARASEPARSWLLSRHGALDAAGFPAVHAGAGRRLGSESCELTSAEQARLSAAGAAAPAGWPLAAVARAALCCRICELLPAEEHFALLLKQFRTGDNAERAALLHTLPLLPEPERFVELAIDACRSHVQTVFEAIACENPYPARFFPEANFNQLVLKAFFTGVAVRRIEGLPGRRTAELARMALAYASERRAAGRSIPPDLDLVTSGASS
ncbi:MAG TPA: EboA domain-containing protein [Polyangiaceae bacterium]|nr:EboA domain-containing protein [Polyangiaceae bacterium]